MRSSLSPYFIFYGVTHQAIVRSGQNIGLRYYHKGKYDNIPLIIFCPDDNYKYPYTTEKIKKALFYYHIYYYLSHG